MTGKLRKSLDNSVVGRMLLTDLSKTFYCSRCRKSFCLMLTMFTAVTVNHAYSFYAVINNGVPEGFLLGSFLKKFILQINFCGTIALQTT